MFFEFTVDEEIAIRKLKKESTVTDLRYLTTLNKRKVTSEELDDIFLRGYISP